MIKRTVLFSLLFCAAASPAERIPELRAATLAGPTIALPADLSGRTAVLMLGFSKKSSEAIKPWADAAFRDFNPQTRTLAYEMPVLEDVPSFIRGMVIKSIRKPLTEPERARFVPILENEAAWKKVARFSAPDGAYILLIDSTGEVRWQTAGPFDQGKFDALKSCASRINSNPAASCKD